MEEIYIEQTSSKTIFKTLLLIFFFLGILIGGYLFFHNKNILRLNQVTLELGDKVPDDIEIYVKNDIDNVNAYELNTVSVSVDENGNIDEVGEFPFTVKYDSQKKSGKIIVKDTTAPNVRLKQLTVGVDEEFLMSDFIVDCNDLSLPCKVEWEDKKEERLLSEVGTHSVSLKVSDKYGNSVIKKATLIVSSDKTLLGEKESDLEVVKTDPSYEDFDGTVTVKYERAVSEELLDTLEEYDIYLELASTDYNEILEEEVLEQEILTLYNKYGYIVGFTVRLTLSDGTIKYMNN